MSILVKSPGLLTTIQDLGRFGFQNQGVTRSGAMDAPALRIANLLVDNPEGAPALEMVMQGAEIFFEQNHLIAITGSDFAPEIDHESVPLWRPVTIKAGSTLKFKGSRSGRYCYLAINSGFDIPKVLNSYSTFLRAGIGGHEGRALKSGDRLICKESQNSPLKSFEYPNWVIDVPFLNYLLESPIIRVLEGPEADLIYMDAIYQNELKVSQLSDRMGYRLEIEPALIHEEEIISSAVSFGTIQLPPNGQPLALMADSQTTGGYPRIAQIITADLPKMAQVMPGKKIILQKVTLEEAQELFLQQERNIALIKEALIMKRRYS
jgi:antagonist of KipI